MRVEVPKNISITPSDQDNKSLMDKLLERADINTDSNGNQKWDDLEKLYHTLASSSIELATEGNKAIALINTIGTDKAHHQELLTIINGFKSDLTMYSDQLVQTRNRHVGKTGLVVSGDDLMECLGIFTDYNNIREKFNAVLFPSVISITEHTMIAVDNYKKKEAIQNPNVVTDVEFKEKVKEN